MLPIPLTWLPALTLSTVVLAMAKAEVNSGHGRAVAALTISSLWLVLAVGAAIIAAVAVGRESETPPGTKYDFVDPEIYQYDYVYFDDVEAGDCLVETPEVEPGLFVPVVPCNEDHQVEAFAVFQVRVDDSANQRRFERVAWGGCLRRFEDFGEIGYQQSRLEVTHLRPDAGSLHENRDVICYVKDRGRTSNESLAGARR